MSEKFLSADDFIDSFSHDFKTLELDGKSIPIRAMTVAEIFVACKRIPKFRRFLQDASEFMFGSDQAASEVMAARFNGPTLMDVALDAGLDAVACFVACCLNRPHDEEFEKKLLLTPDTFLLPALSQCKDVTLGGQSIEAFFTEKLRLLNLMGLMKLGKTPKREPTAANRQPSKRSKKAA
ncbi:hypothetical protein O9X99_01940 [Agrobacterium salinitolerans]|uniref:Uncharacterized protein n=1 Tax=Agrobacterium salinitolerans TaxID=1183413 RepID=A0ABY3BUW4_9HYPH|nr:MULTISPECIES: hypothetical protein [Agrobacterium]MCZ7890428.1 hypothetical protein [Agrobacterium salinitolerans]TRA96850.1 hypothetical protein EXN23_01015 [Agrobacterium salinitolerans]